MAPNKFERHIKKHLQQREIPPSESAWERISEDLESNGKSKKIGYLWYGIAASFIGLLFVSILYFTINNFSATPNVQIVESPNETNPVKNNKATDVSQESEDLENSIAVDAANEVRAEESIVLESLKRNTRKEEAIAINTMEHEDSVERKLELPRESMYKVEEILNAKILEVVDQVRSLESKNIDLTDTEVDSLLRKAQTEMVESNTIQNGDKVDPMALLTDVEDQLDRSFRDKLFDRLKTGFVKVRTAVADSDN